MKFRKHIAEDPQPDANREEVRNLAEALSLYRSAMHHVADREAARHPIVQGLAQGLAEPRPARSLRLRLFLAPALAAAVVAAVLVPLYSHFHRPHTPSVAVAVAAAAEPGPTEARVNIDDTALMNQIDSDLSEDVPDALQPLADLSNPTTTTHPASEKKNATQE